MKKITFNWYLAKDTFIDKETGEEKLRQAFVGEHCDVNSIQYIEQFTHTNRGKKGLPYLQMYNCPVRVGTENLNWQDWNNCVFTDIDSDEFYNNNHQFDVKTFFDAILWHLKNDYPNNFYCMNISNSGLGFKVIWYFDCEKTEENYKKAHKQATEYIKQVFYACDDKKSKQRHFKEIIEYPKVLDTTNKSPYLGFYFSPNGLFLNDNGNLNNKDFGFCDLSEIELAPTIDYFDLIIDYDQHDNTEYSCKVQPLLVKHIGHFRRRDLYEALIVLFKDKEIVDKEWEYCMNLMPIGNHNTRYYIKEPNRAQWYKRFNPNRYHALYHLNQFGYVFKEKDSLDYNPDKTIDLERNQYISDYTAEIKKHMIYFKSREINVNDLFSDESDYYDNIYIKADCGTGKSVFFKKIIKEVEKCIIVVHLNSIKEGVYKEELKNEIKDLVIPTSYELKKIIAGKILPNKMVLGWDQLKLLCEKSIDLSEYLKLFDEIHNVISTFNYRNKTIWPIVKNQELQHNCIIVSATCCGEHNIFCSNCYKFQFNKKPVYELTFSLLKASNSNKEDSKSTVNTINDIIKSWNIVDVDKSSRKIIIFDNMNHAKFARFWTSDIALHFCRDNRKKPEVEEFLKTNILKKHIFITTTYGLEGIEIKNEIDNLFVFVPLYENNITTVDIEQLINRFRNIKKTIRVIFVPNFGTNTISEDSLNEMQNMDIKLRKVFDDILQNNTTDDLKDKEEYFISKRLLWNYAEIIEEIDPYLKHLKIYHNYIIKRALNTGNLQKFYPTLTTGFTEFSNETEANTNYIYKALGNFNTIHEIIGIPTQEDCKEVLNNLIQTEKITYEEIRKFIKVRKYFIRLLEKYGIEDALEVYQEMDDIKKRNDEITIIQRTKQYKFIINLAKHFIKKEVFNFSAIKRFLKARTIVKSKPLTTIDINIKEKETKYYNNVLKRLGVTDNLVSNFFLETQDQLQEPGTKSKKRIRSKLKFQLITNNNVQFHNHQECYEYLKEQNIIDCSLITYSKNGIWKEYFVKI